jgi:hypothetical protein
VPPRTIGPVTVFHRSCIEEPGLDEEETIPRKRPGDSRLFLLHGKETPAMFGGNSGNPVPGMVLSRGKNGRAALV